MMNTQINNHKFYKQREWAKSNQNKTTTKKNWKEKSKTEEHKKKERKEHEMKWSKYLFEW